MTSFADASAAPTEIVIDQKKWLLHPMDNDDFGVLQRWVEDRLMDIARRNCEGLPVEVQKGLMESAYAKAVTVTMFDAITIRHLGTLEGTVKMVWLSARKSDPSITENDVHKALMADPAAMERASAKIPGVGNPFVPSPASKRGKVPKTSKSRRA